MKSLVAAAVLLVATTAFAAPATYKTDRAHSEVTFKIRHLMSNVSGTFNKFDGTVVLDKENLAASSVEFSIDAASIDTGNENRDKHLQSADFFEVEKYPAITFKSTAIKATKTKDLYDVTGDFTMHGVTKRITLPVQLLGFLKDPWGNEKVGFEVETTINRKDFGIIYNKVLDAGSTMLGEDVKVSINLQLKKQ